VAICGSLLLASGLALPAKVSAQPALREQTALKLIPDDAAFFTSSLRLKQQFDVFVKSKAFARISEFPFVKSMVEEVKKEWSAETPAESADKKPAEKKKPETDKKLKGTDDDEDDDDDGDSDAAMTDVDRANTIRNLKIFWSDPANRELVGVGLDAISNEVFLYGDGNIIGFLNEIQKLNLNLSGLNGGMPGQVDLSPDNETIKALLDSLDKLPVPAFVVGFKLSAPGPAKTQLARLEKALQEALTEFPDVAKGFRREKVGPGEFLVLKLDGSKIPWDELIDSAAAGLKRPGAEKESPDDDDDDASDSAADAESAEKARAFIKALAARLNHRSLTLSLGLHENYLLFSFGETNATLAKLSGKGKRLIDRPELAPLLKSADKPLTGISYVSREVESTIRNTSNSADAVDKFLETWGEKIGLDEEAREKLVKDIKGLVVDAGKLLPDPGAIVEWKYLTSRGYEGYSYHFGGGDKSLDGSKKLTILENVGGDPLIVVAARHKGRLADYQFLAKALGVMSPYLDKVASEHLPPPYDEQYSQIKEEFAPLVEKFHTITGKQLLPALAEGQSAFVLDAKPTLAQLLPPLPPAAAPLPFPAPALVYGVSDAKLLKQACGAYLSLLQDVVNAANRLYPEQVPAITLSPPAERDVPGGKLYVYELPSADGEENTIAPNGGLGANVAVLSLVPEQATRFLTRSKFVPAGVLARSDKPAARVWYVNFAGILDVTQAWANYGFTVAAMFAPDAVPDDTSTTVNAVFEILKCWRGSAGISYFDGKTLVEFSEIVFEDLK